MDPAVFQSALHRAADITSGIIYHNYCKLGRKINACKARVEKVVKAELTYN